MGLLGLSRADLQYRAPGIVGLARLAVDWYEVKAPSIIIPFRSRDTTSATFSWENPRLPSVSLEHGLEDCVVSTGCCMGASSSGTVWVKVRYVADFAILQSATARRGKEEESCRLCLGPPLQKLSSWDQTHTTQILDSEIPISAHESTEWMRLTLTVGSSRRGIQRRTGALFAPTPPLLHQTTQSEVPGTEVPSPIASRSPDLQKRRERPTSPVPLRLRIFEAI